MELEISGRQIGEFIKSELSCISFLKERSMSCLMMEPILEEFVEKFRQIKFAKINIDDHKEIIEKLDIKSIPMLIIFKQGKEVERISGINFELIEEKLLGVLS
ncbi:thiol reductase thioredoxin [Candidatus Woesearchaeota archaeon CG10_big_fil_rev_8_21_14_0_10_34_12]|nr:MAG: thiol reductase thioredoxin [Candidatus Woesearchaeota archaeon CG10_big_fil_rev_8_21_14_0_10_34_12]